MRGSRKFCQGRPENGSVFFLFLSFFCHQRILQRAVRTALEKQLDPMGPIASQGTSVTEFLRNPIATCEFPGGFGPYVPRLYTHMQWEEQQTIKHQQHNHRLRTSQ